MIKVLLDTNFLMYCAQQKIQFIEQIDELINQKYELIILDKVMDELNMIKSRNNARESKEAKLVLDIIRSTGKFKIEKGLGKNADDSLLLTDSKESIIATIDRELRKRFKNACFLTIKHKKYLDFIH
jgi:rRNA-processing protein FCF1